MSSCVVTARFTDLINHWYHRLITPSMINKLTTHPLRITHNSWPSLWRFNNHTVWWYRNYTGLVIIFAFALNEKDSGPCEWVSPIQGVGRGLEWLDHRNGNFTHYKSESQLICQDFIGMLGWPFERHPGTLLLSLLAHNNTLKDHKSG